MSELAKQFLEKNQTKRTKKKQNQCRKATCEHKTSGEKYIYGSIKNLGLELTMKGLRNHLEKKSDPKIKNSKN